MDAVTTFSILVRIDVIETLVANGVRVHWNNAFSILVRIDVIETVPQFQQ